MTLIVGIKCHDGVVVGADGAATFGNLGDRTIQQPVKKLQTITDEFILGVSGPVGFGQIYAREIGKLNSQQKQPDKILRSIQEAVWGCLKKEVEAAQVFAKGAGPGAMDAVISLGVVAMEVLGEPSLFQFNHLCSPEEATAQLPFVAIGSGQRLADPFLAFLRRVLWPPGKLPSLSDGIFATIWTLDQAILTNTGGVSEPIQIMTLFKQSGRWRISELEGSHFQEHRQNIADAERALKNYQQSQVTGATVEVPRPPQT